MGGNEGQLNRLITSLFALDLSPGLLIFLEVVHALVMHILVKAMDISLLGLCKPL